VNSHVRRRVCRVLGNDTQEAVKIALWEALERLIPAYCDAVSPTKKEITAICGRREPLSADEYITLLNDLWMAHSCDVLRALPKKKSAAAGSGK
jgi:hypothetical protein